jgi:hypothetical protein
MGAEPMASLTSRLVLTTLDGERTVLLERAAPYCPARAATTGASASAKSAPKTK